MRLLDIFSRHPRGDISAHADGELAPDRLSALEAHLTGCAPCRTELGELLAVRSALHDLPQVTAPRSFTLTPAMAEREPAPVTWRTTPSFVAMRVAGAGFAAVLAVVVMLDAGGLVDDSGGGRSDESTTLGFLNVSETNRDSEAYDLAPGGAAAAPAAGGNALNSADGVDATSVPGDTQNRAEFDGDDDEDPAFAPLPDDGEQAPKAITTTSGNIDSLNDIAGDDGDAATESDDGASAAPAPLTADDDGVSSLLIIEIGLAALAAIAIGGSFAIRRR
jgi:anti-sigma factor RsiW